MLLLSLLAVLINYAQSTDYINDKLYVEFVGASDKFNGDYEWVDHYYPTGYPEYEGRQIHGYYRQVSGWHILIKLKWTYKVDSTGNTVLDEPEYGWRIVDIEGLTELWDLPQFRWVTDVVGCIGGSAGCSMSSCGRVTVLTQRPEECAGSIDSSNGNPIIKPIGNEIPLKVTLPEQPDDLCIIGPSLYGGGQYEYKGNTYPDGKPYWQQKACTRPYEDGEVNVAGGLFLSYNKDSKKYYISGEIGKRVSSDIAEFASEEDLRLTYCSTPEIDSPLDCKSWTVTNLAGSDPRPADFNFAVHDGYCPDVLGDDEKFTGIKAEFPDDYAGGDTFNGNYDEIGLNMFKKEESTISNPIYLYFDPYYFQWRFIGSYTKDENSWVGDDPDHFTCPAYTLITDPYAESDQRGGWPIYTNINEVFQQFNDDTLSYKVPLPFDFPDNKYDPNVKATEFITLTAIEA